MDLLLPGANVMKLLLSVPKNVTLAFSYKNKTEIYCRLCRDSPAVVTAFIVDFEAAPWRAVVAEFTDAVHSITVRQFDAKCRRWDFKGTTW